MPNNSKDKKGLGKTLFQVVGLVSFLFGSIILLAIVFGAIGSIFMSTKRLFEVKRVEGDEDELLEMAGAVDREIKIPETTQVETSKMVETN